MKTNVSLEHCDAALGLVESNDAVLESEERPVTSDADILAGVELAAALADDDVTRDDRFTTEVLYAEPLRVAVATVA